MLFVPCFPFLRSSVSRFPLLCSLVRLPTEPNAAPYYLTPGVVRALRRHWQLRQTYDMQGGLTARPHDFKSLGEDRPALSALPTVLTAHSIDQSILGIFVSCDATRSGSCASKARSVGRSCLPCSIIGRRHQHGAGFSEDRRKHEVLPRPGFIANGLINKRGSGHGLSDLSFRGDL